MGNEGRKDQFFALCPTNIESTGNLKEIWEKSQKVVLPDAVFTELLPSLTWVPTTQRNGQTYTPGNLGRNYWQRIDKNGSQALEMVCRGWKTILTCHSSTLKLHTGSVLQRGMLVYDIYEDYNLVDIIRSLDTLLEWSSLLNNDTHALYHFDGNGDCRIRLTRSYQLDLDPVTCRAGSKANGYHALKICPSVSSKDDEVSAVINALIKIEGTDIRNCSVDIEAPYGILLHQRLVNIWLPLIWSQIIRLEHETSYVFGLKNSYNVIDLNGAKQAKLLCEGLKMICSVAPSIISWPSNQYSHDDELNIVWWNYETDKLRLNENLEAIISMFEKVESNEFYLLWCT
jgi:hypothetical protein